MNKYRIRADIQTAKGSQYYLIKANSKQEALNKFFDGEAEFEFEEFEIMDLYEPTTNNVEMIDE